MTRRWWGQGGGVVDVKEGGEGVSILEMYRLSSSDTSSANMRSISPFVSLFSTCLKPCPLTARPFVKSSTRVLEVRPLLRIILVSRKYVHKCVWFYLSALVFLSQF